MTLFVRAAVAAISVFVVSAIDLHGATAHATQIAGQATTTTPATLLLNAAPAPVVPVQSPARPQPIHVQPADPVSEISAEPIAEAPRAGDTIAYPTLAAAVAAQRAAHDEDEQLRCLATSIYFEAKGEPLNGQLAVAEVILNRASKKRFGNSICDVITQRGQFSFVRGGVVPAVDPARPAYRTALAVARVALADGWDSGAGEALYFHARRLSPGWKRVRVASIGNHVFYR